MSEMQIKTTMKTTHSNAYNQEDWPYQVLGGDRGNLEHVYIAVYMGMQTGTATLEHSFIIYQKVKHVFTILPNHSTPNYLLKRN